jgi:hypothetical protein
VYIHEWLSEQLLESQTASRKLKQAPRRVLLKGFLQAETLFWIIFFTKRKPKIVKTVSAHSKSAGLIIRIKIFISRQHICKIVFNKGDIFFKSL